MALHSSTLAWKIPRAEEPGGLQSTGSRRVEVPLTSDSDRKVPADLGQESQASSWVEAWTIPFSRGIP